MTNTTKKQIEDIAARSALAWDGAREEAEQRGDTARAEAIATAADECAAEYEHAIDMIARQDSDDWRVAARHALERVEQIEQEYGDGGHARAALAILADAQD